jgi:acyl-CoA-dependent ceramide synthase
LAQIAFWIETMIALNIEKRRKDYWHMFAHHVITILLIVTSYASNFTRVGNLILCQMDLVDILLPVRPY